MAHRTTVLLVDIDSTLVENRFSRRAIGTLLDEMAAATGKTVRELGSELGEENTRRQQEDADNVLTMDWDDILLTLATRYNVTLSRPLIELWEAYAALDEVDVLDNAADVMRALKTDWRKLIIATKGLTKYQRPVLQVAGLLDVFDTILTPDNTGYLKTSSAYFDGIRAAYPGALFIQIGDHYYDDVICAKRNGFLSIMRAPIEGLQALDPFERPAQLLNYRSLIPSYARTETDVLPDAVVVSLQELPDVVGRLEAQ
jgi:putative hydrolase of the HAD superfamily